MQNKYFGTYPFLVSYFKLALYINDQLDMYLSTYFILFLTCRAH